MRALVERHPAMLHTLDENHRQVDIGERAALEQLRAGNVGVAAGWYHAARPDPHAARPGLDAAAGRRRMGR